MMNLESEINREFNEFFEGIRNKHRIDEDTREIMRHTFHAGYMTGILNRGTHESLENMLRQIAKICQ